MQVVERRSGEEASGAEPVNVSDERWQLQVEVGVAGGRSRSGCKEPVEVGGAVERSQEAEPVAGGGRRCKWQLERRSGEEAGGAEPVAKKQVEQSRLHVSAVTVPGRDKTDVAKKEDDPGQMSSGRCKWRLQVQVVAAQSGGGGGR